MADGGQNGASRYVGYATEVQDEEEDDDYGKGRSRCGMQAVVLDYTWRAAATSVGLLCWTGKLCWGLCCWHVHILFLFLNAVLHKGTC